MSYRDASWFVAGAVTACALVAGVSWLADAGTTSARAAANLPAWHPQIEATDPVRQATAPGTTLQAHAQRMRRERNFPAAREAYAKLAAQGLMTADTWADYADVVASVQNGRLDGEAAKLIETALRADPDHPKALWLSASLAHQQRRYGEALATWQRLREILPADSPDQRILAGNMEEASRLAGGGSELNVVSLRLGREFK